MKWIILGLLVIAAILFVLGWIGEATGRSADESVVGAFYFLAGIAVVVIAIVIGGGWALVRAFS